MRTELPSNRARFGVRFSAVERTAAAASTAAAKQARALDQSLAALGVDRVRLNTSFLTRPLYDQYRQKDGTLVDNQRADKIDSYEVTAGLTITVRDVAVLERAYRTAVAAKPTGIDPVRFSLEPDNATKTWLATEAVKDAARRARQAVEASGGRLGAPKVVDPSGGVCQTQVLAGWPSYVGGTLPTDVERPDNIVVTGAADERAGPGTTAPRRRASRSTRRQPRCRWTLQPPARGADRLRLRYLRPAALTA